ncbi:MAG: alpha-mannosidase [Planctomycetes bacterium GWF2_42_9]|nr:MAG: alpha-mannosidase [Planctomycetes bacterium GWF2_42_9]
MNNNNATVCLICNAHLDPVWLWEWQEGAAEAISTFRTAVEICEQHPNFIFNHNEVILYKWVEEYDIALFKRIQKLVKAGRWHIMGGWYLQPDCNMPSGESIVRQILAGRAYFKDRFGVFPTTAINFDSFGHSRGLVQIIKKSGYDSYLFGRPEKQFLDLKNNDFVWVGYDGSEILATRFVGECMYRSPLGKAREKIEKWLIDNPNEKCGIVLWGVGNHGGGPSKVDIKNVNRLIADYSDRKICHSRPEDYFKHLRRTQSELPHRKADLNPWAPGCYTSMIRVKQKHRLLENELYVTEKMASSAFIQRLIAYPNEELKVAQSKLLMAEFHDILPGSAIQSVEETSLRLMDVGLDVLSEVKARVFFALATGQKKAKKDQIPILVYNPHPFTIRQIIECEFNLAESNYSGTFTQVNIYKDNKLVPSQVEKELSNIAYDWRKRIVFLADLAPGQMNRFDCTTEAIKAKPPVKLKQRKNKIVFRTKELEIIINTKTGFIDRYRVNGRDMVNARAFVPIVIKDNYDSWEMMHKSFRNVCGKFKLMDNKSGSIFSGINNEVINSVRVIEDGPVRSVVESVLSYGKSFICQRYMLPKYGTEIEVELRVLWNEKDSMLKLSVPACFSEASYRGQVMYGTDDLPSDGTEVVAQKWVAAVSNKDNKMLTCINDGIYGSDFSQGELRLTLLRSPAYACGPVLEKSLIPEDRFSPRMEQGERLFRFWFNGGKCSNRSMCIEREALVRNEKPVALSFFPSGEGSSAKPLAIIDDKCIVITAIKKAENNDDIIVRLFEPTGHQRATVLSIPSLKLKIKLSFDHFEIKTLRIEPRTGKYYETNLMEEK